MTQVTFLRHGATDWSADRRLQGLTDLPLSAAGRAEVSGWRLPRPAPGTRILTSPLARARQTAEILGLAAAVEPRLAEASWGDWEGRRLVDLARDPGAGLAERERAGLDFRPPGGESPRETQARLAGLLAELARDARPVLAICHKGVILAAYALATGWDRTGRPAHRLIWDACHAFSLDADGRPQIARLNMPLAASAVVDGGPVS